MPSVTILNVNGIKKKSTDVTYNDLIWLYKDFENKYGRLPTTNDGKAKNNLPQQRIIKKILNNNHTTYNNFLNSLGKVSHVRTESKDFNYFSNKFKSISDSIGRPLLSRELINNSYGLPSANWFVKNCPDDIVRTYDDFIIWCGYKSNKLKKDDEIIAKKLIRLEQTLNRPITKKDITLETIGFSPIVINRIWGGLDNCKKTLGLMETNMSNPKPFSHYKLELDNILAKIKKSTGRKFITWKDIENEEYNSNHINHKTFLKAFSRENIDIFAYIKSKDYMMNPSNFSYHYTFDDGERVASSLEYDFSKYLKELGYIYNQNYQRDVMYKNFLPFDLKSKINCDYVININGDYYFIEIGGIIHNSNNSWETEKYSSQQENKYQKKLIYKKDLLLRNGKRFLFLFPEDFAKDEYKQKFIQFMNIDNSYK